MNGVTRECAARQEQIVLLAYGELGDAERHELEQHQRSCPACRAELASVLAVQQQMRAMPMEEPSASLLATARIGLDEALDRLPPMGGAGRLRQAMLTWMFYLRSAPAMALLLLVVGFAGGGVAGLQVEQHLASRRANDAMLAPSTATNPISVLPEGIASISGVTQQPGSNLVQVRYNRLVPGTVEADVSDPRIQQLLVLASQSRSNPGVRVDSVSLLADQCQARRDCDDSGAMGKSSVGVRQALMASLRNDRNAGVRLKALDGLAPYVAEDEAVRDAILQALLHDDNPGIRTQAIQMLAPVEADGSVRRALHRVAVEDANPYLRTVSQETLEQGPEIQ